MTPELKQKWIEKLESGQYKQCTGVLYNGDGYCCLGVLIEAAGGEFVQTAEADEDYGYQAEYDPKPINGIEVNDGVEVLSNLGLEMFGLTSDQQQMLTRLNDGERNRKDSDGNPLPDLKPKTFREISQVIREAL